jgi:hypothetical protein
LRGGLLSLARGSSVARSSNRLVSRSSSIPFVSGTGAVFFFVAGAGSPNPRSMSRPMRGGRRRLQQEFGFTLPLFRVHAQGMQGGGGEVRLGPQRVEVLGRHFLDHVVEQHELAIGFQREMLGARKPGLAKERLLDHLQHFA